MKSAALLWLCAGGLIAQPLVFRQTGYRLRAGERVTLEAEQESLDFLRSVKSIKTGVGGIAVGPGIGGGEMLGVSLTTPAGDYTVTVSAVGESERTGVVRVTVDALPAVPVNNLVPPVVLLNGWQFNLTGTCPISNSSADTFGSLGQQLMTTNHVPVVYFYDNCVEQSVNGPAIEQLGTTLGQFLGMIQYNSGGTVPVVDLVGHSMGGLIVRSYFSGLQVSGAVAAPSNVPVRKFVEMATPNFGSYLAENYSDLLASGTQGAEMIPGSTFLWNVGTWNQRGDDLRGVDALAIIGNEGSWTPSLVAFVSEPNAGDGLVSLTSGSLGFARDSSRTRIVPYCHTDTTSALGLLLGCTGAGIANADNAPLAAQIVLGFLAGNSSVWMSSSLSGTPSQNTYLSQDGGILFGWVNTAGQEVTDVSGVTFGSVSLTAGRASGTFYFDEFAKGSGTFTPVSKSMGSFNCGSVAEPAGSYTAWRCKSASSISSVTPVSAGAALVQSGANITINGVGFGAQQCSSCQVSASNMVLKIVSWSDTAITAVLPAYTSNQSINLAVVTATGGDSMTLMVAAVIGISSISNAASSLSGPIAPGEIVAVKGSGLGPASGVSFATAPTTTLAGTRVLFGGFAAPLLYTSAGQVNAVVPYEVSGQTVVVEVDYQGLSTQSTVTIGSAAPGLFTLNSTGVGPAAALNQDGTLNGATNPAVDGSYVSLYMTGGGQTNPAGVTGSISGTVLKNLIQNVSATIGGQTATVAFAGAAPGYIDGFLQVNLMVPAGVHGTVAVMVTVGGVATPGTATLAVQ